MPYLIPWTTLTVGLKRHPLRNRSRISRHFVWAFSYEAVSGCRWWRKKAVWLWLTGFAALFTRLFLETICCRKKVRYSTCGASGQRRGLNFAQQVEQSRTVTNFLSMHYRAQSIISFHTRNLAVMGRISLFWIEAENCYVNGHASSRRRFLFYIDHRAGFATLSLTMGSISTPTHRQKCL